MEIHALNAACVCLWRLAVLSVLAGVSSSQVFDAVVPWIAVDVIDNLRKPSVKHEVDQAVASDHSALDRVYAHVAVPVWPNNNLADVSVLACLYPKQRAVFVSDALGNI